MQIPIFPNSSYLLSLGASAEQEKILQAAGHDQRIRTFFCPSLADLEAAVSLMEKVTGLIVFEENINPSDGDKALNLMTHWNSPVRKLKGSPHPSEIVKTVGDIILEHIPPQLEAVLKNAAEKVFPMFIDTIPELKATKTIPFGFDRQLSFSLVAGDVTGLGVLRIKLEAIEKILEGEKKPKALEICQEAMNQCMGLIVQRLVKIGLDAKSGLPTIFDITSIPELQFLSYYPSVHLTDPEANIALSLGFFDVTGAKLNFKGIEDDSSNSEEVEFL